jgi:hypothetical protein
MMIGGSSIMTFAHVLPAPAVAPSRSIAAAVIGNAMEWYDFAVHGFLASVIGKLFFPRASQRCRSSPRLAYSQSGF